MIERSVAIVTGAGSSTGIGFATAQALGRAGHWVVIASTTDRIKDRAAELRAAGIEAHGIVADLTVEADIERVREHAEALGNIDILVNNAGMAILGEMDAPGELERLDRADWQRSLDRNLTSAFLVTRAFLLGMKSRRYGRVINVSSTTGTVSAVAGDTAYAAAKAGMVGFTRAVALESAPYGVTVNAVAPGFIKTALTDKMPADILEPLLKDIPLGRVGLVEDVANAVAFLVSDQASYITGQVLSVDGGLVMS